MIRDVRSGLFKVIVNCFINLFFQRSDYYRVKASLIRYLNYFYMLFYTLMAIELYNDVSDNPLLESAYPAEEAL